MQNILIIDDNEDVVFIYKKALEQAGFVVQTATDAETGWNMITTAHPDVLILDIILPGKINGFDILEKFNRDPAIAIPTIVLTNVEGEERTALSLGAKDYVLKEKSTTDQLIEKIRSLMPKP